MDILEFAMKMELDGKAYYKKHAAQETKPELKEILITLADEEQKHYIFFKKMKEGDIDIAEAKAEFKSNTLKTIKNIFNELAENKEKVSFGDEAIAVWTKALAIEEKAEKFYREKATEETDTTRQTLLNMIADEERNHVHMIDGVLTYLRFPDAFGDSAQFKNFRSLEGL